MNPERINIKDLTIEEPEKEGESSAVFDAERDITDAQWQLMKQETTDIFNDEYEEKFFVDFLHKAVDLKMLFPERAGELQELNDSTWETLEIERDLLLDRMVDTNYDGVWELADFHVFARILYPQKAPEMRVGEKFLDKELEKYRKIALDGDPVEARNYVDIAAKGKITFPEKNPGINLDDEIIAQKMEVFLMDERDRGAWANFLSRACGFKILFPGRMKNLNLSEDFWKTVVNGVKSIQPPEGHWQGMELSTLARFLKILAADEIKISKKGIELLTKAKEQLLEPETPSIPETRSF